MAAGVQKAWSATASSNANSDSNINFAEGQAPSTVNDSARAVMAGVKAFANQIGGAKTTAGAGNAYTFTSDAAGAISVAYGAGMIFRFKADKTNTGAATFNADAVGVVDIRKGGAATALVAGDIVQNGIYDVAHNGTYFILLNPETGQGAAGFQPLDATLTALAALSISAGSRIYGSGSDTFGVSNEVGVVQAYAGSSAPTGWLLCYGQAVSRTTYAALFSAISTTYGSGDGSTTFNLPDLRGRVAAGKDNMGGSAASRLTNSGTGNPGIDGSTLGAAGGADRHTLTEAQMPAHSHSSNVSTILSTTGSSFNYGVQAGSNNFEGLAIYNTGSSDAHPIVQPTMVLNYIIFAAV